MKRTDVIILVLGVGVSGNSLKDPDGYTARDPLTKSPIIGIEGECRAIAFNARALAPATAGGI